LQTDRGAIGSAVMSQITLGRKNRLWISLDGDQASLSFDQEVPESLWIGGRDANTVVLRGSERGSLDAARYSTLPPGHPQGYQDSFNAFVADAYRAIQGDPPDGLPTFEDGWRAAAITDAVLRSARSQSWVEVAWPARELAAGRRPQTKHALSRESACHGARTVRSAAARRKRRVPSRRPARHDPRGTTTAAEMDPAPQLGGVEPGS
jgi:hypothetical protein